MTGQPEERPKFQRPEGRLFQAELRQQAHLRVGIAQSMKESTSQRASLGLGWSLEGPPIERRHGREAIAGGGRVKSEPQRSDGVRSAHEIHGASAVLKDGTSRVPTFSLTRGPPHVHAGKP
jgi:hypothetical protein